MAVKKMKTIRKRAVKKKKSTGIRPAAEKQPVVKNEDITYYVKGPEDIPAKAVPVELSASDIITRSYNAYADNFFILLFFGIIGGFMQGLGDLCGIDKAAVLTQVLFYAANLFFSTAATISLYFAFSMNDKGIKLSPGAISGILLKTTKKFFIYVWTTFLYVLIILGGCILLIVPGIIFEFQYIFAPMIAVLDDGAGGKYFEKSLDMTEGYKWKVFLCSILVGLSALPVYLLLLFIACLTFLVLKLPINHKVLEAASAVYAPVIMPYYTGTLYMMYKKLKG